MLDLKFSLSKEDIVKILKGAVIAALGAGIIYALEALGGLNWGIWGPAVTALAAILVNIVRKYLGIG